MRKKQILLTNEEANSGTYENSDNPTVPSTVNSNTNLNDLNLNWSEKELPERTRTKHVHRLHPYLGKFIPQIVEVFLRKYFAPGMTVLDPFAGSGTTLIQANELNINAIGYDISAFNVLLMQAKTHKYDLELVKDEILDILRISTALHEANSEAQIRQLTLDDTMIMQSEYEVLDDNEYINQWFAPQAKFDLLRYRELIKGYHYQDILKIILSRSARSARLTTHFDLDFPKKPQTEPYWCYKHSRLCRPTTKAQQFIKRYSLDTIRRLEAFAKHRTDASVDIVHGDSQTANIPVIDGVITSPPYVGLIDYHDQHKYAYELLGLTDKSILEIGPAKNGSSKKAITAYKESITNVFNRIAKSTKSGGYFIVIAGDKFEIYNDIARACNLEEVSVIKRHVNRRTGRRSSNFYESVFIWRKP